VSFGCFLSTCLKKHLMKNQKAQNLKLDRIQSAFEGATVTINCTYQTAFTNPTLFWYQQKVSGIPKYMLNKFSKSGNSEEEFKDRFHANLSKTSVPLTIQDVRVSDSAVYYCALQPTVTETHSTLIQELQQCSNHSLNFPHPSVLLWDCPVFFISGPKYSSHLHYIFMLMNDESRHRQIWLIHKLIDEPKIK
uniref:Ig-like domain-containing protein n=1 Tax=Sinocyclocheilus anshuiensis TaxID=1608454 RepID=A0A671SU13_9TELE